MKKIIFSAAVASFLLAYSAHATTIVDLGSYGVGYFTPTVIPPSGLDITYLQNMVNVYNGSATSPISGENYTISQGSFTPATLPNPLALASESNGNGTSFNINLGAGGYSYLIAQWDGGNGADAVYYLGGLTGTIDLQNTVDFVNASSGAYGLSGYWLATASRSVPDGGVTVALLGMAILGLAQWVRHGQGQKPLKASC